MKVERSKIIFEGIDSSGLFLDGVSSTRILMALVGRTASTCLIGELKRGRGILNWPWREALFMPEVSASRTILLCSNSFTVHISHLAGVKSWSPYTRCP
jgi:heme/copper-type cytochrome/quinol oxidase subunit 3